MSGSTNPFAPTLAGDGYLDLLHLGQEADRTLEQIAAALSEPTAARAFDTFMGESGWRPHLVGAIAVMLDHDKRLDRLQLWNAVDAGSWVTPQLVVAALFSDPLFSARARHRIELRCPIQYAPTTLRDLPRANSRVGRGGWLSRRFSSLVSRLIRPATRNLDSLVQHVADGPGTGVTRSGKLMASLLGVCHRIPALADHELAWRTDPEVAALLAEDVDHSDALALRWMSAAEALFLQRGIHLRLPSA